MSVAVDSYQNRTMGISLVLNVLLALGVIVLLPTPQAGATSARVCDRAPAVTTPSEAAQTGKIRERVTAEAAGPARIVRGAKVVRTSATTTPPAVTYIRCRRN